MNDVKDVMTFTVGEEEVCNVDWSQDEAVFSSMVPTR